MVRYSNTNLQTDAMHSYYFMNYSTYTKLLPYDLKSFVFNYMKKISFKLMHLKIVLCGYKFIGSTLLPHRISKSLYWKSIQIYLPFKVENSCLKIFFFKSDV